MKNIPVNRLDPFGAADCESELRLLGADEYSHYYFPHTRFNQEVLKPRVFLIVGRRGSGKTALSQFFSFQTTIPNAVAIDVDEPAAFQQTMTKLAESFSYSREVAIPQIAKIWEVVIWSIIFRQFQAQDHRLRAACMFFKETGKTAEFIRHFLDSLVKKYTGVQDSLTSALSNYTSNQAFQRAKEIVLKIAKDHPIIVAFDTLENYSLTDEGMLRAIAALIQAASNFNQEYTSSNIHIKLFLMDEIFPRLKDEVVTNTLKFIKDEMYLYWRPKDLMKIICWRFWQYLVSDNLVEPNIKEIDWDDHNDVLKKVWDPYFGSHLVNGSGLAEKTFPYVLRHTQLRPRQLIVLCNSIAKFSKDNQTFPNFSPSDLINGIKEAEDHLAAEVFNAYNSTYPNAARIAEALSGLPLIFEGKELDKRAKTTSSQWTNRGEYSLYDFRQFLAELGIVGRVRNFNEGAGVVEADFEYARQGRLPLLTDDLCVIHPMFYRRLNTQMTKKLRVYPFPDHPDFIGLEYSQ